MDGQHNPKQQAVVYLRIANSQPDDATVIMYQREGCRRIAAQQGLTIIREYVDVSCPARLEGQTELQRLLNDLDERRDATFVVVWDYARLGRSVMQLDAVVDCIRAYGAEVVTITGVETVERFLRHHDNTPCRPPPESEK